MNPAATSTKSPGSHEVWVDFFDDAYRELYAGLLDPIRTEVEESLDPSEPVADHWWILPDHASVWGRFDLMA